MSEGTFQIIDPKNIWKNMMETYHQLSNKLMENIIMPYSIHIIYIIMFPIGMAYKLMLQPDVTGPRLGETPDRSTQSDEAALGIASLGIASPRADLWL